MRPLASFTQYGLRFLPCLLAATGLATPMLSTPAAAQTQTICIGEAVPPGYVITSIFFSTLTGCTPAGQITKRTMTVVQPIPTSIPVCFNLMRTYVNPNWVPPATHLVRSQTYVPECDPRTAPPAFGNADNAWWLCEKDTATNACKQPPAVPALSLANSASFNLSGENPNQFIWGVAPDSLVTGFGSGLSVADYSRGADKPCSAEKWLRDRAVVVRDKNGREWSACVLYIGPGQVNFHMPPQVSYDFNAQAQTSLSAWVTVRSFPDGAVKAGGYVPVRRTSPGLFTANSTGRGYPAAYVLRARPDGSQATEQVARFDAVLNRWVGVPIDFGPPDDVLFLILYGTGIRGRPDPAMVSVTVGGMPATVEYSSFAPGFDGLDQLNVRLDRNTHGTLHGTVEVIVKVNDPEAKDKTANRVTVDFR